MTTVGFGDITPVTPLGKFVASPIMLFGYAIIIVPTGIFSAEVISGANKDPSLPQLWAVEAHRRARRGMWGAELVDAS